MDRENDRIILKDQFSKQDQETTPEYTLSSKGKSIMETINDALLREVLFCNKVAVRADRKKLSFSNRHRRNNVFLASKDKKYEYKLFMRQSEDFLEDFSVGLIWTNPSKFIEITKSSVILVRCQGPHDGKEPLGFDIHHDYHIHTITLEDFKDKRYQKPSGRVSTSKFSSFEQAIFHLMTEYKVDGVAKVVDLPEEVEQTSLF